MSKEKKKQAPFQANGSKEDIQVHNVHVCAYVGDTMNSDNDYVEMALVYKLSHLLHHKLKNTLSRKL